MEAALGAGKHTHDFVADGFDYAPAVAARENREGRKRLVDQFFGDGVAQRFIQLGAAGDVGKQHGARRTCLGKLRRLLGALVAARHFYLYSWGQSFRARR